MKNIQNFFVRHRRYKMRDERITIRVSKMLMALLESRATTERKTKSDLVREILKAQLKATHP